VIPRFFLLPKQGGEAPLPPQKNEQPASLLPLRSRRRRLLLLSCDRRRLLLLLLSFLAWTFGLMFGLATSVTNTRNKELVLELWSCEVVEAATES